MKKCPFCAEDIQDEAKVCKHCGRDLVSSATAQKVEVVQPKQRTGCFTWLVAIFFGLVFLGWCAQAINPTPTSSTSSGAKTNATTAADGRPPLALLSSRTERSSSQHITVVGEVANESDVNQGNVRIIVNWYTKDGQLITSDTSLTELNPILPGQRSAFDVISTYNPAMDKYTIQMARLGVGSLDFRDARK